jgi:hypothetical protein
MRPCGPFSGRRLHRCLAPNYDMGCGFHYASKRTWHASDRKCLLSPRHESSSAFTPFADLTFAIRVRTFRPNRLARCGDRLAPTVEARRTFCAERETQLKVIPHLRGCAGEHRQKSPGVLRLP